VLIRLQNGVASAANQPPNQQANDADTQQRDINTSKNAERRTHDNPGENR
jgi:hypothetical protein